MVICFTSFRSLGCTFLDWSFNWLMGHTEYWFEKEQKMVPLVMNPLGKSNDGSPADFPLFQNAHQHKKNHPIGLEEWTKIIRTFKKMLLDKKTYNCKIFTFYGSSHHLKQFDEYQRCILDSIAMGTTVIFLYCGDCRPKRHRLLDPGMNESRKIRDQAIKDKIKSAFRTVKEIDSNLSTVSKMRDFIAINMAYLTSPADKKIVKFSQNLFTIEHRDLILNGEKVMDDLFKFLDLKISKKRYSHWLKTYKEWREPVYPEILFYKNLPEIVCCIKNGLSHSLKPYKLDIFLEAVIQNKLMTVYKDRLMLKNLEEFPDNTNKLTSYLKSMNN